jgi:hypothetical protein
VALPASPASPWRHWRSYGTEPLPTLPRCYSSPCGRSRPGKDTMLNEAHTSPRRRDLPICVLQRIAAMTGRAGA